MSEITDKEIEQLEKEFQEALKAKPKPNRIIVDDKKVKDDLDKELEEMNKNEGKINKSFESNKYDNKFLAKLEKHLSDDSPNIVFYDKIKCRGNNVIGINFTSDKFAKRHYSRKKIDDIGNDLSNFLQEEGIQGTISNSLLFNSGWRSGYFSEIGQEVILADMKKYMEFYEEPKEYKKFQLYLILKPKPEGGNDKFNNDCLYH